jgi:hypothetical protein
VRLRIPHLKLALMNGTPLSFTVPSFLVDIQSQYEAKHGIRFSDRLFAYIRAVHCGKDITRESFVRGILQHIENVSRKYQERDRASSIRFKRAIRDFPNHFRVIKERRPEWLRMVKSSQRIWDDIYQIVIRALRDHGVSESDFVYDVEQGFAWLLSAHEPGPSSLPLTPYERMFRMGRRLSSGQLERLCHEDRLAS